jgi:hypothetical protein
MCKISCSIFLSQQKWDLEGWQIYDQIRRCPFSVQEISVLPRCAESLSQNICFHLKLQDSTNHVFLVRSSEILAILRVLYIDIETYILIETFSTSWRHGGLLHRKISNRKLNIRFLIVRLNIRQEISKIDVTRERRFNDTIQSSVNLVSIDPR